MPARPGRAACWAEPRSLLTLLVLLACLRQPAGADAAAVTPGEILLRWHGGTSAAARLAGDAANLHIRSIDPLLPPRRVAPRAAGPAPDVAGWLLVRYDGDLAPEALAARIAARADVAAAQPNYLRRFADYRSDDPRLDEQWALEAIGWTRRDPGSAAGVLVAIIDSGVEATHPDLVGQLWRNHAEVNGAPGLDDDGNGYVDDLIGWDFVDAPGLAGDGDYLIGDPEPDDESGHGTHVAGIVAAGTDNGVGIAGVAPGVGLMALRAGFSVGGAGYLQDDDIARAIVYAVDNGAHIINLSLGDPRYSPLLADAVGYADEHGVVVVAAAGNEGSDEVFYPARLPQTIAVTAVGRDGRPASFSNFGPSVDLSGPGVAVLSTQPAGSYGLLSGTSMAAPHVAAAAALVLARHPEYTPLQVLGALTAAADDVAGSGWDARTGHGLVQVVPTGAPSPLAVSFLSPDPQQRVGDGVDLRLDFEGPGALDYQLDWGAGPEPPMWRVLAAGTWDGPNGPVPTHHWSTTALAPGLYSLRARVRNARGATHERRLVVPVAPASALITHVAFTRALEGRHWRHVIDWISERPTAGFLELTSSGERIVGLPTPAGRREHRVLLPLDVPAGRYGVRLYTDGSAPVATDSVVVVPDAVDRWQLRAGPRLPGGYLMPHLTDFDADGWGEVVAMVYGADSGLYKPSGFFEWPDGTPAFTSTRVFLPWNVQDLDVDGRREIMAVDARRVRLLEQVAVGRFPERAAWEVRDVWGGEVADGDGDGWPEMYLPAATASLFRVFEARGDDDYVERTVLTNDTPGDNDLGGRQVAGDLDGDGRGDLLTGDSDGDLIIYEAVADDVYRRTWHSLEDDDLVDGRLVGGGADLDGDGEIEFVGGRLRRDPFDLESRRWTLTVYGARGDDDYAPEWSAQVLAGLSADNGITSTDLDGDGELEWIVAVVPQLYIFRASDRGGYEAVWHAEVGATQRPAVGDADGDGRSELVYNGTAGELVTVSWAPAAAPLHAPPGWQAGAAGADRAELRWQGVPDAARYVVYRDGHEIARTEALSLIDSTLVAGVRYGFRVAAVDAQGRIGQQSVETVVEPHAGPVFVEVARSTARQLIAVFDQAMAPSASEAHRYVLVPEVARVSAAMLAHGGRRLVLGFDRELPETGQVWLHTSGVRSLYGVPLAGSDTIAVDLSRPAAPTRMLAATVDGPREIRLSFDRVISEAPAAAVTIDGGDIHIDSLFTVEAGSRVVLSLSPLTPLRPLGRPYEVIVDGLRDDLGRTVTARTFVAVGVAVLDQVTSYPNPYRPLAGALTFAGLPAQTVVQIHSLTGELVWRGRADEGDGGLRWRGRNAAGSAVAAGVYLVRLEHAGTVRRLKVAVVSP